MAVLLKEEGLTFDDVLLLPQYSETTPDMASLKARLTKKITLNVPLLSAAMDTVTEKGLATALALQGGIGIIHKNMAIAAQADQVKAVKKAPVDARAFPQAAVDSQGRLLCGAALGITADLFERAAAVKAAGADAVVLDSAHGFSGNVLKALGELKRHFADLQVICGNVATYEGARALAAAGADAVKVGMGPGSICSTRIVSGMGVPQFTAVMSCARITAESGIPVIADGGIRYSGDITKALAAGASTVMLGSLFAQCAEAAGPRVTVDGVVCKAYRGMGSVEAMAKGSTDRYFQTGKKKLVAEGVAGTVPLKGDVAETVFQLMGGLRSGMGYLGAADIATLQQRAVFIRITSGGLWESHPHGIKLTGPEPNYDGIK